MSRTEVYCTAPWNGLTIREDGHVRTCCVGETSLGNLNEQTIESIESGPVLAELRKTMLSSKPHQNCRSCVAHENHSGLASLRQHYLRYYPNTENLKLQFLDIRWNNICNLGCMYCNPTFSSVWSNRLNPAQKNVPVKTYQDDVLLWILNKAADVKEIMLVGGEPMLMKQNYALLAKLPMDSKISIITNLSYDLENLPCIDDLLRRPQDNVVWNVSLENTGKQFEYVRSGAQWAQVEKNLKYISNKWPVTVNAVYSVFSAFGLIDTVQAIHRSGIKKMNLVPINQNASIDMADMPLEIKKLALAQLIKAQEWHQDQLHPEDRFLYPFVGFDELKTMLQSDSKNIITWATFEKSIDQYDQWGQIKFHQLWPEVFELMKKYLK